MTDSILIIDDEVAVLRAIGSFFEQRDWDVFRELSGEAGLLMYDRVLPDVVLVNLQLPGMDGMEILERLRGRDTAVILLTSESDVPTAVRAMQAGAENFLVKPVDMTHLLASVERAAEKGRLRRVNRTLIGQSSSSAGIEALGSSPQMREVGRQLEALARADRSAVLIQGEPGTGKRWVARLLHDLSSRSQEPFVEIACHTDDARWLELELFGREDYATDQTSTRRQGLLEVADGGVVYLDDVGVLQLELQGKLQAMLQTRSLRRVGGTREIPIDLRLIMATTQSLQPLVEAGRFRQDLYDHLQVMPILLPPLRERGREDLLTLIKRFLKELTLTSGGGPTRLSDDALERLIGHTWPGNVRELHNVLERAVLLARLEDEIGAQHLPGEFRARSGPFDRRHMPLTMEEVERMHLDRTLKHHGGNRTKAAEELGISRATLIAKIKRYAIPG